MALRLICMSVSPELQYHVEELSLSTPNELWTKLEARFRIKKDWEECMQEIDKTMPIENPPEEQASLFEGTFAYQEPHGETSIQVYVHPFVPFIRDDVYSISDLFSKLDS